jgi:hypothetical protein
MKTKQEQLDKMKELFGSEVNYFKYMCYKYPHQSLRSFKLNINSKPKQSLTRFLQHYEKNHKTLSRLNEFFDLDIV